MATSSGDTDTGSLSTARRILLSSPPGQFDLILSDLQKLTDLTDEFISDTRRIYGERTGSSLLLDTDGSGGGGGENCTTLRSKMTSYMTANYSSDKDVSSSFRVTPKSTSPDDLTLETYAERVSMANYHSGSWHVKYEIQVLSSTSASVKGTVNLRAHAFESGNVQLNATKNLGPMTVSAKTTIAGKKDGDAAAADWADAVLTQVKRWECNDIQNSLAELYDSMCDGMLKSMRRVMPVTRTKMDWNVSCHRLVQTLNKTKKSSAGAGALAAAAAAAAASR